MLYASAVRVRTRHINQKGDESMNPAAYSAILYSLAEGIHPVTGDFLPEGLID